ncbi:hypothetical protein HX039_16560 [Myroides marinus]|uniref:hypothetical protein n=1 Tax=Myroides marinus TaxID=703342 RepID=UPI002578B919|nr:hypothetical protein [Myroides marinus]MDM1405694.1 hypothetical protein [Myroides marinus]
MNIHYDEPGEEGLNLSLHWPAVNIMSIQKNCKPLAVHCILSIIPRLFVILTKSAKAEYVRWITLEALQSKSSRAANRN